MTSPEPITLTTTVDALPGVGAEAALGLRALGLTNLGRLVAHLPMRHELLEAESTIDQLQVGVNGSVRGEVTATRPVPRGPKPRFHAVLVDDSGRLELLWFNALYLRDKIAPGVRLRVHGVARPYKGGLQMINPRFEVLREGADDPPTRERRLRPVYPASERCDTRVIERVIARNLAHALPLIEDHLPDAFRADRALPTLTDAYRMQHAPEDEDEVLRSQRRLAFDELLLLQLGVHLKRAHLRSHLRAPALRLSPAVDRHIRERIPHTLTPGQEEAVRDVARDLSQPTPTNRLIQGDVGSGKTTVALYAMLLAVADAHQAALMAPTELLAEQHFLTITRILQGSRVKVELLTGSVPTTDRDRILRRLLAGEIDILIGTHALLTEDVRFKSLALAVIDEQHRFGVHQRSRLREQASDAHTTPHVLVMTATPIPRTLAITLFGDLDISVVRGLPPGRRPVTTIVANPDTRAAIYADVEQRIAKKQQAFVIAPAIEGSDDPAAPLRDVRTIERELNERYLPGRRVAVVHAQLSRQTRDHVMARFRSGLIDVLVATTVIEVGVDIPNASAMIIEQADRFGLAQLHQLRGRVGRGEHQAVCYLVADPATPEGEQRLGVLAATTDGFEIAEKDLEIRGPGELFGVRQWGLPPFNVADIMRDRELLALARRDAADWIARSPRLDDPGEQLLRKRLLKTYGESLGLADVG